MSQTTALGLEQFQIRASDCVVHSILLLLGLFSSSPFIFTPPPPPCLLSASQPVDHHFLQLASPLLSCLFLPTWFSCQTILFSVSPQIALRLRTLKPSQHPPAICPPLPMVLADSPLLLCLCSGGCCVVRAERAASLLFLWANS